MNSSNITYETGSAISLPENRLSAEKRPVTIIAETLGRDRGGAEIYLTRLAELLAQKGHPVQVYVRHAVKHSMDGNVQVEVVPTLRRTRIVWERRFASRIARRMGGQHEVVLSTLPLPGITHYQPHSGLYRDAFEAFYQSMEPGLGRTLYSWGNGLNFRRHSLVKMQEELLSSAQAPRVMTFSQTFRAQLLKSYPALASQVVTVPLGVDLQGFQPGREEVNPWLPERKPGQLVLLFVGHNFRLKGLASLFVALREAMRQGLDAALLVVGARGRNNQAFPAIAALEGISAHVRFLGPVPDGEMNRLYQSCDALVHPTFSDHCSLVVLEALACGLPVVTTRQNGAAELIESGKQGIILDHAKDTQALASALLRLQDRRILDEMRAEATALRPRIDFNAHARQVLAWLTAPRGASS